MKQNELIQWLQDQQVTLESIICEAAREFVKTHDQLPNFGYDLALSQNEGYNLSNNKDLCYDRFTTPLAYSLWYQARRINIFISHFINKLLEACSSSQPVDIFDLGAGTGCVQFCFGLAMVAHRRKGMKVPMIRIINVDVSPFMLNYLKSYLWPKAVKYFPELKNVSVEYHVNSWSNKSDLHIMNPWICASYLFDSSENEEYLTANFNDLVKSFNPDKVLMLTSSQDCKEKYMKSLSEKIKALKYEVTSSSFTGFVFTGSLLTVNDFRSSLVNKYGLKASSKPVSWDDRSFTAIGLEKKQSGLAFDMRELPSKFDLFNPTLKIRRDVQLNDDQKKAAKYETKPSIITGPAGCGKSVVVTEKIINILEKSNWNGPLHILVTTFNKSLLKQLREWLTDLIKAKNREIRQTYYKTVNGSNDGTGKLSTGKDFKITLDFVHFEKLAKYIGDIAYMPFEEIQHVKKLELIIHEVRHEQNIPDSNMKNILTPKFLLEEYHRIIYGRQCRINLGEEIYQEVDRIGRVTKLNRGEQRKAVWSALNKYAKWMNADPQAGQSFVARRQLLYNKLKNDEISNLYDYVFVDEFQDCTKTDFEIMNLLLKDSNNLILAGDMAQAVHIGKSGFIPKDEESSNRNYHRLNGSYRLPFRICEAILPLSQEIKTNSTNKAVTAEIAPYKGAPPGARPIMVFAENSETLAQKIIDIKSAYSLFDLKLITIMEKDDALCQAIRRQKVPVETTTILRLKGLEKEFIVWSLQAAVEFEDEVMEFAYTIMTRTNCLLIIALTPESVPYNISMLKYLRQDRVIFWDKASEQHIKQLL